VASVTWKADVESRTCQAFAHLILATLVINSVIWGGAVLGSAYEHWLLRPVKEHTLREDLRVMRKMIDQYTADSARAPRTLEDLVTERYLPHIPDDPMTGSAETWKVVFEDEAIARDGECGIVDVKSGSTRDDSTGRRRYCDW
jgi:general secretion pathway protein G